MANYTRRDPIDRFAEKIKKTEQDCWLWTGSGTVGGYPSFWSGERFVLAHRWSYEHFIGAIPDGLVLDHLCRVKRCVNPAHLDPVTQRENVMRSIGPTSINAAKTHCPRGHPYDEANTYVYPRDGSRRCRTCIRAHYRFEE